MMLSGCWLTIWIQCENFSVAALNLHLYIKVSLFFKIDFINLLLSEKHQPDTKPNQVPTRFQVPACHCITTATMTKFTKKYQHTTLASGFQISLIPIQTEWGKQVKVRPRGSMAAGQGESMWNGSWDEDKIARNSLWDWDSLKNLIGTLQAKTFS